MNNVGLTGPLMLHDNYSDSDVLIFFCVMIKREVFDKIGILDEIFAPGGGEDIDFTIRARAAGYEAEVLGPTQFTGSTNVGAFPIWHKDNKTFVEMPEYTKFIVKRNGLINCKRHNKDIKLNLGSGGINYPGYLSVDFHDPRAHILMDCTKKLDFEDNTVSSIMASHLFEHINPYLTHDVLVEWLRTLKPGGRLIMEMPDIEQLCARFGSASKGAKYGILNAVYGSVNTTDSGLPSDITSPHLFGWWPESIWDMLSASGYINIMFGPEQWPHPESNMHVEASKPLPERAWMQKIEPFLYREIFELNSYKVTDAEIRGKTVIDIGANAGYFSLFCVEFGAKKILAIEAQPTIYRDGLCPYTKAYQQIIPIFGAVHSESGLEIHIPNNHLGSKLNFEGKGEVTITQTLEQIIKDQLPSEKNMVLKLDCEGSEFDILNSTSIETLRLFSTIYIEIHEGANQNLDPNYQTKEAIHSILNNAGFKPVHQDKAFYNVPYVWVEKWQIESSV